MFENKPLIEEDNIENLHPLELADLTGCVTDFDLFLDIAGKPVLYARGYYEWSPTEIEKLSHDGFSVLFYEESNQDKVAHLREDRSVEEEIVSPVEEQQDTAIIDEIMEGYSFWIEKICVKSEVSEKALAIIEQLQFSMKEEQVLLRSMNELRHHDSYSFYHSIRTAAYGALITVELGSPSEKHLLDVVCGCLFHDLGHVKIDPNILDKKGKLTDAEWAAVRQHPRYALEMLETIPLSKITKEIILRHHERVDGKGYPFGLKGDELIQEVRTVSFCDVFDALTSPRPYQRQMDFKAAFQFIEENLIEFVDKKALKTFANICTHITAKLSA